MFKLIYNDFYKIRFIILLLINVYIINRLFSRKKKAVYVRHILDIFNSTIKKNTVLIIELNEFHHECTPGYAKYFIELGYNIDILIHINGIDSFCLFKEVGVVRLLAFKNLSIIKNNTKKLSAVIKNYNYILLQSNYPMNLELYDELGIFQLNNTIFVSHELVLFNKDYSNYSLYFNEERILTLGNFSKGLQVNPHYFGNIKIKVKNSRIRFFLTSTLNRNYTHIIKSAEQLKKENFNFEIIITGRSSVFNSSIIPHFLNDSFSFNLGVSYSKLYQFVEQSDYIIIPLDPKNQYDNIYKNSKVSGSIQLMFGFLKPAIINQEFAEFNNLNTENSLIYNNSNIYNAMRKAILLDNKEYKKLQKNLRSLEKCIFRTSMDNLKKIFDK